MDIGLKKFTLHTVKRPFKDVAEKQEAYRALFNTPHGSKVLQDILAGAGYFEVTPPNGNSPSPDATAHFNNGKKYVCHDILNAMTVKLKPEELQETLVSGIDDYDNNPINGV